MDTVGIPAGGECVSSQDFLSALNRDGILSSAIQALYTTSLPFPKAFLGTEALIAALTIVPEVFFISPEIKEQVERTAKTTVDDIVRKAITTIGYIKKTTTLDPQKLITEYNSRMNGLKDLVKPLRAALEALHHLQGQDIGRHEASAPVDEIWDIIEGDFTGTVEVDALEETAAPAAPSDA